MVENLDGDGWRIVPPLDQRANSISIDSLVPDAEWFWLSLQRFCVPDCCGLDAYDFSPDSVAWACGWGSTIPEQSDWRDDNPGDPKQLAAELRQAAQSLRELDAEAVHAKHFNHILTPEAYANLFDDLAVKVIPRPA